MGTSNAIFSSILYCFLLATFSSAGPFISDAVLDSGASTGRALLQVKKACKVDFENKNYTILTSQCKGPAYPPDVCCNAFKQFACPFTDEINDVTTDCSYVMFSYINVYGKYPPGLFSNECKEGVQGLDCTHIKQSDEHAPSNSIHVITPLHFLSLVAFLGFFFHFF
ncbi:GPI-anchored protein LLG2-like [Cajanus cajan]|uniref:GPI-anchored protein LLG2-like n=2 Tax=Cajanus cajan TaxID=3821 RepID=UPI00098D9658|nr:GPI-anchored protein LLG2-like [Cajanus cajan]